MAATQEMEVKQVQTTLHAVFRNDTPAQLTLGTGGPYPTIINPGSSAEFAQLISDTDSTAAVVYFGVNTQGAACGWLLAWRAPSETSSNPNRVYGESGPKSAFQNIDWNRIKAKLDGAGTTTPPASKVRATIREGPNKAILNATFVA